MTALTFFTAIILTLVLAVSIYDFYSLFYGTERIVSKHLLSLCIFIIFAANVWIKLCGVSAELSLVITYLLLFITTFNYKTNTTSRFFGSCLAMIMISVSEMVVVYTASGFLNISYSELLANQTSELFLFSLARFLPFSILKIIKLISIKRKSKLDLGYQVDLSEYGIITILPLFSIVLIHLIYLISETLSSWYNIYVSISILLILLLNVIFYFVYWRTLKLAETESILVLQEKQIDYYSGHYDELKLNLDEVHKFKHDVKHILMNAITDFSDSSNIEVNKLLYNRLDKMIDDLYLETYKCFTGIPSLDMVLNYQLGKAKQHDIVFDFQLNSKLKVNVDSKALAIILGNSLDNAIEACILHNMKKIEIVIVNKHDNLYLSISNNYVGEILFEDDLPITSKENPRSHGIGLKSIKQLVESNNGFMLISTKNGKFNLRITFANN